MFDLSGRTAIVTGGNGGIGLGMAKGLADAGAGVVIAGRNVDKSKAALEEIEAAGGKGAAIAVDVTDESSIKALVELTVERFGRLDIMVCNAGINIRKRPEELSLEEWRQVQETNLDSIFLCAKHAYPGLKKAGGGKIITIGSMMSLFALPPVGAYAASKGGVVQLTKALATAWAKDNIQANCVLPGWIDTDLTRRARQEIDGLHDRVEARTPAGRWGTPKDMAGIAVFLASPASDFVNGTAIPVDGGYAVQG